MDGVSRASLTGLQSEVARGDIRRRFAGAFRVRPWIYWTDMLGSTLLGWLFFGLAFQQPALSAVQILATAGSILLLLRAALFIHELTHVRPSALPGFEVVWNVIVGIPIAVPSLMYVGSHSDHHRRTGFGTNEDPEYAPIAHWSRLRIALFVATVAFVPFLLALRWGVIPVVVENFEHLQDMFYAGSQLALETSIAKEGDVIVVVVGLPIGFAGTTNLLRVITLPEPVGA